MASAKIHFYATTLKSRLTVVSHEAKEEVPCDGLASLFMIWWMAIGSGGSSNDCSRRGISVNFMRGTSNTCSKYLSQLIYSRSLGSCNWWVLMYCHMAWRIMGRVAVCTPSSLANLLLSLYWDGWYSSDSKMVLFTESSPGRTTWKPSLSVVLRAFCHSIKWLSGPYISLSNSIMMLLKKEVNLSLLFVSGLSPVSFSSRPSMRSSQWGTSLVFSSLSLKASWNWWEINIRTLRRCFKGLLTASCISSLFLAMVVSSLFSSHPIIDKFLGVSSKA